MTPTPDRENGSASVELALLTPLVVLILLLIIAGARVVTAHAALDQAATTAARAASLARTPHGAQAAAHTAGSLTAREQRLHCHAQHTRVDTTRFGLRAGQYGSVTTEVSCAVGLEDLGLPGIPGTIPLVSTMASPTDPFRGIDYGFANSEGTHGSNPSGGGR